MKILALSGSPRKAGNTERYINIVLEQCAAAGAETELVRVFDLSVKGCRACLRVCGKESLYLGR